MNIVSDTYSYGQNARLSSQLDAQTRTTTELQEELADLQDRHDNAVRENHSLRSASSRRQDQTRSIVIAQPLTGEEDFESSLQNFDAALQGQLQDSYTTETSPESLEQLAQEYQALCDVVRAVLKKRQDEVLYAVEKCAGMGQALAEQQDMVTALHQAVGAKNDELVATRECFQQERATHQLAVDRVKSQVESLDEEIASMRAAHTQTLRDALQDKAAAQQQLSAASGELLSVRAESEMRAQSIASLNSMIAVLREEQAAQRTAERELHSSALNRERSDREALVQTLQSQLQAAGDERQRLIAAQHELESRVRDLNSQVAAARDQLSVEAARGRAGVEADLAAEVERSRAAQRTAEQAQRNLLSLQGAVYAACG